MTPDPSGAASARCSNCGRPYKSSACGFSHATIQAERASHTSARECNIYHHDGAYKCYTHNRCWGAITNAVDPCPGWKEPELVTTPSARDLLAEIDATLKLGRERHLDFRVRAFDLLVRLRPLVEREERKDAVVEAVRGVINNKCLHGTPGMYGCESADRLKSAWAALVEEPKP